MAQQKKVEGIFEIAVRVSKDNSVNALMRAVEGLKHRFTGLGPTIIYLDRLFLALGRSWATLSEAIGATRVSESARDFYNFSQMLGLGVEQFQAFTIVAGQFDAKIRDVVDAFMQMSERSQAFIRGDKSVAAHLKGSGLTAMDLKGKDVIETFKTLSVTINKLPTMQRMAALQAFFGEEGSRQLGPLLTAGPQKLVELMQEAYDLGAVMSAEQIDAARRYNVQMNRVRMVITAMGNNVARVFMPALGRVADWLVNRGKTMSKFINDYADLWARYLVRGVESVLDAVDRLVVAIERGSGKSIEEWSLRVGSGMAMAGAALTGLVSSELLLDLGFVAKLLYGLSLVVDDLWTYSRGGKSVFGEIIGDSPFLQDVVAKMGEIRKNFVAMKDAMNLFLETFASSELFSGSIMLIFNVVNVTLLAIKNTADSLTIAMVALLVIARTLLAVLTALAAAVVFPFEAAQAILTGRKLDPKTSLSQYLMDQSQIAGDAAWQGTQMRLPGMPYNAQQPTTPSAFTGIWGPTAYAKLFGPDTRQSLQPMNQTNNITITSTGDAQATANELSRVLEAARRNGLERTR